MNTTTNFRPRPIDIYSSLEIITDPQLSLQIEEESVHYNEIKLTRKHKVKYKIFIFLKKELNQKKKNFF